MRHSQEAENVIHIEIKVAGRVTQADIIGAVFGQTEDVLGEKLELRNLQRNRKIGRIEVEAGYNPQGTKGMITIPSYMDRTNTVIIAAALETIKKIGPCEAEARVKKIENIKEIKIRQIIDHAKKVLEKFLSVGVDSQELVDEVANAVRAGQATTYGKDKVPCGPSIERYDELIFVETVGDMKNLLKHGIKNVVVFEDASKKDTLRKLAEARVTTVFINRGKEYLVKRLLDFADIDNMAKPEGGKRVSELTSKELHKAIRSSISCEQVSERSGPLERKPFERKFEKREERKPEFRKREEQRGGWGARKQQRLPIKEEALFKTKKTELKGSGEAYVLDNKYNILGKLPTNALAETIKGLGTTVHAIIIDGKIPNDVVAATEKAKVRYLVGDAWERSSRIVNIVKV